MNIELKDMITHFKPILNKFEAGLFKAKLEIGHMYVQEFKKCFDLGMDLNGRFWRPRKRNYSHPILQETGTLKNSISFRLRNPNYICISTNEYMDPSTRKRGGKSSYAAFHNSPDGKYPPNIQRQFIGDSPFLEWKGHVILYNFMERLI